MIEPTPPGSKAPLEVWGGIECSFVRVDGDVRDQLALNGHDRRLDDLDRIADLGIRTLRYPLLWERHAGAGPIDWTWADERLNRLRELGIRPIVGFVHHGSGPLPGGLVDPGFVTGLAAFARSVAERYPWIDAYTPVNEPNTTARFSGLYGLWHPHGNDVCVYGECLLNECLATRAAMKVIRDVNPAAELIQTEDVGKTHSTPHLAYQAAYENERRWLTFDLLYGRIAPDHPVYAHLLDCGFRPEALESFVEEPCPPDVIGMNHYVTSERFLDERLDRYPRHLHGGNGREAYADVDAVRVRAEGLLGIRGLLRELWQRYERPIALTEVQLACTREEQVRWLVEAWDQCKAARHEGIDVRAITPWSLFGSFDWDTLLVKPQGNYENGAFDIRGRKPRLTAVGAAIRKLAREGAARHPVLSTPGWWRRPVRLEYTPVAAPGTGWGTALAQEPGPDGPPIVILGAAGTLGRAFVKLCELRGLRALAFRRQQLDLDQPNLVQRAFERLRPWLVVNCAGYVRVDEAEQDAQRCLRANVTGAVTAAMAAASVGARFVTFSSDLVFDGKLNRPYVETDDTNPLNGYGRSKRDAEQQVLACCPEALVVRTSAFFGPWDEYNFATLTLRALAANEPVLAAHHHRVSPTYVPDLVSATLDLAIDGERGLWHLANQGGVSWYEWGRTLAAVAGLRQDLVRPAEPAELGWIAKRPANSVLQSERGALLSHWENALERYFAATPDLPAQVAA